MLKKENRLKAKSAFRATYNNKNTVSDEILILYAGKLKLDKNCPTRVGFVVSKKIHKRAVIRNKIKRLLRENIRLIIKYEKFKPLNNYQSLIFIAKEEIIGKNFTQIEKSILILLNKIANKNI